MRVLCDGMYAMLDDRFFDTLPDDPMLAAKLLSEEFSQTLRNSQASQYGDHRAAFAFVRGYCKAKRIPLNFPRLSGDEIGDRFTIENFFHNLMTLMSDGLMAGKLKPGHAIEDDMVEVSTSYNTPTMPKLRRAEDVQDTIYSLTKALLVLADFDEARKSKILHYIKDLQGELDKDVPSLQLQLDDQDRAEVACTHCQKLRVVDLSDYKDSHKPFKVKCSCGFKFSLMVDMRKYGRKEVCLPGVYQKTSSEVASEAMVIENLSTGGIGFRTREQHDITVDDTLIVRFILDDDTLQEVRKQVHVRYVDDRYIGAQFQRNPWRNVDTHDIQIVTYLGNICSH
jgi:hypothetical protein